MRKLTNIAILVGAAVLTACASGGGSTSASQLTAVEKVSINAPASKVWAKINSFQGIGDWHPAVAKTDISSGTNNQVGAVRFITLQDGGTITETLVAYDSAAMTYSYVIDKGVLPVSDYSGHLQVVPTSSGSEVVWTGRYKRKDTSAHPADGQDDATATKVTRAVYRAGLDNLKKITE